MKKELKLDLTVGIKRLGLITRSLVNSKIVGDYRSVFKGSGLEFHDYRHYTPEDDASMIDWKASIRSQELLVKEFIEERNLSVFFLIDVSSSMLYSTLDKLKIEYSAELIATLSYTILQAGDSVGFALFNDKVIRQQPPKAGARQYYNVVRTLADTSHYGGAYDLCEALKFTMAFLKEFSVVIIISDFIGLKNDWKHYLKLVGKKFDLIGIMIRDPRDEELPEQNGQVILEDMFSNKQIIANVDSIKEEYAQWVESREREIRDAFVESRSDFLRLTTDKPFIKPITDLFTGRTKKVV